MAITGGHFSKPNNPIMTQMKKTLCQSREHWRKRVLTSVAAMNEGREGEGREREGEGKACLPSENTPKDQRHWHECKCNFVQETPAYTVHNPPITMRKEQNTIRPNIQTLGACSMRNVNHM